jgi:hypothetical protein
MMPGRRLRGGGGPPRGRPDDYGRHRLGGPIDLRSTSARKCKGKACSRDSKSDAKRKALKIRERKES